MRHPQNKRQRKLQGDKKAQKVFPIYYGVFNNNVSPKDRPRQFGTLRKTRKFCSDPFCCGNPRHIKGRNKLTFQEKKVFDSTKDQIQDVSHRILPKGFPA